jgi:hypothetical protein|tara:strand:- start:177 stop:425 length:249 start_codon:yes stop_codon:yes gene_type:complete
MRWIRLSPYDVNRDRVGEGEVYFNVDRIDRIERDRKVTLGKTVPTQIYIGGTMVRVNESVEKVMGAIYYEVHNGIFREGAEE